MISLNTAGERIKFVNITKEDISDILNWYNNLDEFKYATGVDKPLTIEEMSKKYSETAVSMYDFFSWIINEAGDKVGIIKGSMRYKEKDSIWINSILIDSSNRRSGYAKEAVEVLIDYAEKKFGFKKTYVSVLTDNIKGIMFWKVLGFKEIKIMEKHIELDGKKRDVAIMYFEKKHN